MLPIVLIPFVLFGGLIVKLSTLHSYIKWIQYLSPIKYAFTAVMLTQFKDDEFEFVVPVDATWRDLAGLEGVPSTEIVLAAVLAMVFLLVALVLVRIKQKAV
jgi:ABC-type multidrug transport system permease subunit